MLGFWFIHALNRPKQSAPRTAYNPADPATAVSALAAVIPPPEKEGEEK
jgi:hypothetical protein